MIPYSPAIQLRDNSWVAVYKIYVLKNPSSGEVFYVGQTSMELKNRLSGHISGNSGNPVKDSVIKDIISKGEKPIIESVETIMGTCYIDKMMVNEREIFWIKYYKAQGVALLNVSITSPDAECREYKTYLRSIQQGQSAYKYYYCGQTYGGLHVYDEKKMNADGFRLPEPKVGAERILPEGYNPWNNPRWLNLIGNKKDEFDKYTYEHVYKDTDPNYYDDDY